jgi:hypothetical protein
VPLHDDDLLGMREVQVRWDRDAAIAAALDELVEAAAALTETPRSAPSGTPVAQIGQSGKGRKRR